MYSQSKISPCQWLCQIKGKERNALYYNVLNTFYLRLYGIGHNMVKDHSDSKRGHPMPLHGLLFPISSKGSLYASSHWQDNTYHGLCYTSRGALAGMRMCQIKTNGMSNDDNS